MSTHPIPIPLSHHAEQRSAIGAVAGRQPSGGDPPRLQPGEDPSGGLSPWRPARLETRLWMLAVTLLAGWLLYMIVITAVRS